jgi:hypothetical protein
MASIAQRYGKKKFAPSFSAKRNATRIPVRRNI